MFCHIVVQVIVMIVMFCVCVFFYVGAIFFVNLVMDLDSIAFAVLLDTRLSISF